MIFSYWSGHTSSGGDPAELPSATAWRARLPGFQMFDDDDLVPILSAYDSSLPDLFRRIRIPACRADLARLLLVYEHGGMYLDAHVGPSDGFALASKLDLLSVYELVLFCREHCDPTRGLTLMNGVIAGRRNAPALRDLIDGALANLREHDRKEAASEAHVPYNIFAMVGAWDISVRIFDRSRPGLPMREQYQGRVWLDVPDERQTALPFHLYAHYGYRKPGRHWSERQSQERLFEPA